MPVNKLALIRYKTIDRCLQNRFRKWTLEHLVDAVSEAVYEYEGIRRGVSRRTVQLDIQNMRSEKMGFSAPIVVHDKKYYTYEDRDYSITNTPISNYDLEKLSEVAGILQQLKGFSYFKDLSAMVARLEDKIQSQANEGRSFIDLDKNDQLKGLEFIEPIHRAILKKSALSVEYQSFKARDAVEQPFSPYLLKEYNNRWFVLGSFHRDDEVHLMALDRVNTLREDASICWLSPQTDVFSYFDDVIGVSKTSKQQTERILLRILKEQLPYLLTKPLHRSQQVLVDAGKWATIELQVVWNYELEREILGLGEMVEVVEPAGLRLKIGKRLGEAMRRYEEEIPVG